MKKPDSKTFRVVALIIIAALVIAGAAVFLVRWMGKPADKPVQAVARPALTVTVAAPERTRLPITLAANGNVTAWQEAIIGAESSGLRLTDVLVNVGDVVKAGQVLAKFSTDSVQADVAQARASLLEAQAAAADAAGNAERARTLQDSGALSTQQINQYNTTEKTAKARAEAAQAVLSAQQLRGRQTQVLAPDSGVISARSATVGAVVASGTELFRLIRQGRLEWRAEVTSAELGRIAPGTPVRLQPASGGEIQGRVRMIAPSVDPLTRTALVYVDLPAMAAPTTHTQTTGRSAGPPQARPAPAEGSAVREATSVGAPSSPAGAAEPAPPGRRRSAPSEGSAVREATSVGAPSSPAGAAEPAPPGRRRSAPSEGSAVREATSVGAPSSPAGAAEPAPPGRRRSASSEGSAVREATSVGAPSSPAGAAEPAPPGRRRSAPSGGSAVREATSVGATLPGMFARGEFELGQTDALTIPQRALVVRDGFNYVFLLGSDNRVSQVKVQTGRLAGDRVEIVSGLAPDTRIVVNGAGFLNDGDLVRVAEEFKPNAPAAPAASAPAAIK